MNWQNILVGGVVGVPAILPSILQLVEVIHAPKTGGAPTGPTKFGAAVNLAQTALIMAASAGAIPVSDAQNLAALTAFVQKTFVDMKTSGMLGGMKGKTEDQIHDPSMHLVLPVPHPAQLAEMQRVEPADGSANLAAQPVSSMVKAALAASLVKPPTEQ